QKSRNSPKRAYQFYKPPWLLLPEPETWSNPCYTSLLPPCSGQIFWKPSWLSQHLFVRIPWSLSLSTSYRYRSLLEFLFWIVGKYATAQGAAAVCPFAWLPWFTRSAASTACHPCGRCGCSACL